MVVGSLDHATVDRIYGVGPGTRIDGMLDEMSVYRPHQMHKRNHAFRAWPTLAT